MKSTTERGGLGQDDYDTLLPRLVSELVVGHGGDRVIHQTIAGTLLSADISGFTRLSEELAERGREGAEIITRVCNSCFTDLIACAEFRGGDVLKFGGDAVLVFFAGDDHESRGLAVGQEMQFALRRNPEAQRNRLQMTVGLASGLFEAMVVGGEQRDLLICGPTTTETLVLEDGAEKGEVVASIATMEAATATVRSGGRVVLADPIEREHEAAAVDPAELAPFVPTALRSAWNEYAELGAAHRQAAIGFVMLAGVDDYLATHGGPATAAELDRFFIEVDRSLASTGAVLLHSDMAMSGLKLVLGAGVPQAFDDPAGALLHAALAVAAIDTPFVVRQGVNIGTVFAGFLGAPHRRTFTVMGDVVNTAARMLGPAGDGDVVAVSQVIDRVRGQVRGELLEPMAVKGKTTLVSAMRVESVERRQQRDADEPPLVGREAELTQLRDSFGAGHEVDVVGMAGTGKTRLTSEIDHERALSAAGGRYMTAAPYGAFWSALRSLFGMSDSGSQNPAQRFVTAVAATAPDLVELAPLLAPLVGVDLEPNETVAAIEPEFRRDVLHRSLVDLLSRRVPKVTAIVVEDAQWLDDASVELVAYLGSVSEEHGWAVIRSIRSEVAPDTDQIDPQADPDDGDASSAVTIELGPLPDAVVEALIRHASPRLLTAAERARLVARAHGNPLFALELARAASGSTDELPGTIEEVIAARIDRLRPAHRRLVRLASILGARFDVETLAALARVSGEELESDPSDVDDVFVPVSDDAARAGDGSGAHTFRFRQLLYRDVAYASMPFARRKDLHRDIGLHLEQTATDLDGLANLLSEHFHIAEDRGRSWDYSIRAAQRASRQNSPGDAIAMYRRALEAPPRGLGRPERRVAFEGYGTALVAAGSLEDAYDAFGRARRLADDATTSLRLLIEQADCRNRQGRFSDALRIYTRAESAEGRTPELLATILTGRSSVLYHLTRNRESYDVAHEALRAAEATDVAFLVGRALRQIGVAGEAIAADDFLSAIERALDIFHDGGFLSEEAEMLNNLGVIAQLDGRLDEAADAYATSLGLKHRVGDLAGAARVQMNLGEVQLDRNSTEGVRDLLTSCLATFDQSGSVVGSAYTTGLLGRCAHLEGDGVSAREHLERASGQFLELGAEGYAADMDLLLLEVLIELDAGTDAERVLATCRERLGRDVFDNPISAQQRIDQLAGLVDQLPD